jgi:hypothetical protein
MVRQKTLKEVNMVKNCIRMVLSMTLLAALPVTGWAQDAKAVVGKAAQAMGAENLRTLHYSGSGSFYDEKGQHAALKSYSRRMDLNATTSSVTMTRVQGTPPAEQSVNEAVAASSPWNTQLDFWITPYGFLKGAMANAATVETKTAFGENYRIVTFTLPGNHKIVGHINDKDMVERVHAWVDNNVLIEGVYRDYADFGGVKIPTIQIKNRAGTLAQVVIVKDAKPNG